MIGRLAEQDNLRRMADSEESEFVAVYGRRRVGKTYLVRETPEARVPGRADRRSGDAIRVLPFCHEPAYQG